jgi:hypothetical protein
VANRNDIIFAASPTLLQFTGAGTNYVVQTPTGVLYVIYVQNNSDVYYRKSTNNGMQWGPPTSVFVGTVVALSVWYDRWSNISAGLIHMAYTESGGSDTLYRTINTESSDALSTQTTIFAGVSAATGCFLSISRARGGNVYCRTMIDAGAEGGFFRLPNANVPNGAWDAARTINEANATTDQMILLPGWAADNQDMIAIFWDASADEISRQIYDDSANSWAETSISTGMVDQVATTSFPHFAAAVDITNSRHLVVAWNAVDGASADLLGWVVTESAITAFTTPVVSNGTDDQGLCAIGIDTSTTCWCVFYGGKSDGSETYLTSINIYYKTSTDAGATWGPEILLTGNPLDIAWLCCTPRYKPPYLVAYHSDEAADCIMVSAYERLPQARTMAGF